VGYVRIRKRHTRHRARQILTSVPMTGVLLVHAFTRMSLLGRSAATIAIHALLISVSTAHAHTQTLPMGHSVQMKEIHVRQTRVHLECVYINRYSDVVLRISNATTRESARKIDVWKMEHALILQSTRDCHAILTTTYARPIYVQVDYVHIWQ